MLRITLLLHEISLICNEGEAIRASCKPDFPTKWAVSIGASKLKTLFKSQGLWEFVESGLPEESSENARQKETIKKIKPFHTFLQIFQRVQMRQTSGKLLQNKEECVTFTWRRKKPLMEATLVLPGSIGTHFIEMVKRFEMDGFIPRGCNSSFIALVPKKQDPLYINDYRPISLIGCQYKVIAKFLANRLQKVVHSVVSEVQTAYIKGRQIIDGPLMVKANHRCFKLASGLKVNFSKSKLFGVGVNATEIQSFANILDCHASTFPCLYLGLPIGANMSKACNWKPIIIKFHKRLASWKARNRGRLTLLESVLGALVFCFDATVAVLGSFPAETYAVSLSDVKLLSRVTIAATLLESASGFTL
ncbi:RNA-directed DNA polymerase, eukaryota, reverse transcriptase zinc-binding domain protein [Tanacetum coccineum]